MEVGKKDVSINRIGTTLGHQALAQVAESGAAIEDINMIIDPDFNAGGIAAIPHILQLWSWSGPANAPELDPHASLPALMKRISQYESVADATPDSAYGMGRKELPKYMPASVRLSIREAMWSNQRVAAPGKTVAIRNRIVIITHLYDYSGLSEAYNRVTISELALAQMTRHFRVKH